MLLYHFMVIELYLLDVKTHLMWFKTRWGAIWHLKFFSLLLYLKNLRAASFFFFLQSCIFSSFMALYLPVIMLQKQKTTPVRASSRQDSRRPICGLEQLQQGRVCLAEFPLTLGPGMTNTKSQACFQNSLQHRTLFHCPISQGRQSKSKMGDQKSNTSQAQIGC